MRRTLACRWLPGLLILLTGWLVTGSVACGQEVQVTVLTILATDHKDHVDPKLKCIADEVKKLDRNLKEFRLRQNNCKSIRQGKKETFPLVDQQTVEVLVQEVILKPNTDRIHRVSLTVKPSRETQVGKVTYTTVCEKYIPILTRYDTRNKERLIIAIMVESCQAKP